ncbi:MAG: carboxypeptidase-like regulatory domain-containing protein [Bacteroidetes bacterium]|nr:carboxypeptidase-like regulatory domain-containing protein [Bacteroidota bacterium]
MRIRLPLFIFLTSVLNVFSQTTHITGKVYNSATNEPMPFVNIIAVGTSQGTVSDIDGNYEIDIIGKIDSIRGVYVGYNQTTLKVKEGQTQIINIPMASFDVEREPVVILPGENPAITILKQVWKNEDVNDKRYVDFYQYEVYNKLEFDLNDISPEMQQRKVMKPVQFIFNNIDSTNPSEKPHLPLFFSESVSDFYYRANPRTQKEVILGSKVSGLDNASVSQFTGDMYQNVDVYKNNLLVFGKTFESPISTNGELYYKYYLVDSMTIDGHWCHQIAFKPRRKQEATFVGNVWIADTSFAVKRVEMNISADANINYIRSFYVIQEFDNASGAWMMTKERVIGDFEIVGRKEGLYGRKTTSYKNIVVNKPMDDAFYQRTDNLIVTNGADNRNDSFWVAMRHDTLNKQEQGIYTMVDSVQKLPIYHTWEQVVLTAYTGYKTLGPVEYGPWYKTLSFNPIEGARLRVGGRTSNNFSKWYELSGYAAYGTKDQQFKYGAGFKTFITKTPHRQLTGVNYKNDNEILGLSNNQFTSDNILATIFRRTPFSNFTHVEQLEVWYERDWFLGFTTRFSVINRNMYPIGGLTYQHLNADNSITSIQRISSSEAQLNIRFAFNEKYVQAVFSRVSVGTKWPIVQFNYTEGIKGVFMSDYAYHRMSINIDDRLRFGPFGYLNYILEAGKTWGLVPYPLMVLHPGNETYVYDWSAFNMMSYYEFVSDQYAQATFIHHFDGFFLNHIPLMRKLKWREVASFKWLIGSVNEKNRAEMIFPANLHSLSRGPYMEAGAGIENIFKFFRVDVFWRLSYLDNVNAKPVGVRISMQVLF